MIQKEGTILENGREYTVKVGDQLILCYEGEETYFTMKKPSILTSDLSSTIYRIIDILEQPLEPTDVEFSHKINGVEYIYQVTLVSEDAATSSEGDSAEQVPGKEWALSLEFDAPKLLAWNDELNTKVEIEEGQEYEMQPGDVLAVRGPESYYPVNIYPEDFSDATAAIDYGFFIIEYNTSENKNPINFVIEGWLTDNPDELLTFTCTLIPPTE